MREGVRFLKKKQQKRAEKKAKREQKRKKVRKWKECFPDMSVPASLRGRKRREGTIFPIFLGDLLDESR